MGKYSRVYSYQYGDMKNKFRYNFEDCKLEMIGKATKYIVEFLESELAETNIEWMADDIRKSLDSIRETGYTVITSEHLLPENWKASREYYMDMMSEDLACEMAYV